LNEEGNEKLASQKHATQSTAGGYHKRTRGAMPQRKLTVIDAANLVMFTARG